MQQVPGPSGGAWGSVCLSIQKNLPSANLTMGTFLLGTWELLEKSFAGQSPKESWGSIQKGTKAVSGFYQRNPLKMKDLEKQGKQLDCLEARLGKEVFLNDFFALLFQCLKKVFVGSSLHVH